MTATEEAVAAAEQQLKELWAQLERDVESLRCTQLVALAGLVDADPTAGTVRYQVRQLHGNPAHFPIREVTLRNKLEEGWTYILHGDRALSLAPVVACVANDDGAGHGLFLAREVGAGSEKTVETVSLTSGAKRKIKLRGQ